ncbi:MAG: GAF domain-containing protein [Bacteroidia bacterium]|jgi:GAF domain-containing protein
MEALRIHTDQTKPEIYSMLLPQLQALIVKEDPAISNISNILAALKQTFHWWWVGLYFVKDQELYLGPFQGPLACTRIALGKGVCGTAWQQKKSILVDNVNQFPGHIACSSESQSELVVPVWYGSEIIGVLDFDSEHLAHFDETDRVNLEHVAADIASDVNRLRNAMAKDQY